MTYKDEVLLLDKLAAVRPDLAMGQSYERRKGRDDADVFLFRNEVVRFDKRPNLHEAAVEKDIAARMGGRREFMVPAISHTSRDGSLNIQSRMTGKALVPQEFRGDGGLRLKDMSEFERVHLVIGLACFMTALHAESARGVVSGIVAAAKPQIAKFLAMWPDDILKKTLNGLLAVPLTEDMVVVHGDLGYGNVFFDAEKDRVGVIDFRRAGVGPPTADLAYFAAMPRDFYLAVVDAYNERSGRAIDYREAFIYEAAVHAKSFCEAPRRSPQRDDAVERLREIAAVLEPKSQRAAALKPY